MTAPHTQMISPIPTAETLDNLTIPTYTYTRGNLNRIALPKTKLTLPINRTSSVMQVNLILLLNRCIVISEINLTQVYILYLHTTNIHLC